MQETQEGIQTSDLRRIGFEKRCAGAVKYGLAIIIAIGIMVISFVYWASFIY